MKKLALLFMFLPLMLCAQDWQEEWPYGSELTVTATPNEGWDFLNWTENGEVVSTNPIYTFTVTGPRNLIANFRRLNFIIQIQINPEGAGQVEGAGTYPQDAEVMLHAIPHQGYNFENFTEINTGDVIKNNPFWFIVTQDQTYSASFIPSDTAGFQNWWLLIILGIIALFVILLRNKKPDDSISDSE